MKIADNYGADACRLYLCNSPVCRAEDLKFSEAGVKDIVKDVFLPLFNTYRFLIQNITRLEGKTGKNFVYDPKLSFSLKTNPHANLMDQWIVAASNTLIKRIRKEMDEYKLFMVVRQLLVFIEQLSNWYVRLNRGRMKGDFGEEQQVVSLNTLFEVQLNCLILMSCITPFITDYMY